MLTWLMVGAGGAIGGAIAVFILRKPSPRRLMISTATVCGLMGAMSAYPYWPTLTAPVTFGVLGSAVSIAAIGTAAPIWLDTNAIVSSTMAVVRKLAVYCAVGVTFALIGYLAVRAATTLYIKLR